MIENLIGKQFGRWIVINEAEAKIEKTGHKRKAWLCECQCKNKTQRIVIEKNLLSEVSTSCGCKRTESASKFCKETKTRVNTYDLRGEFGIGFTLKGEEFYFDLDDYDKIKDFCWRLTDDLYVYSRDRRKNNKAYILMHKLLLGYDDNFEGDHINHVTFDNRRRNIRIVTKSQNGMNRGLFKGNKSGVVGVRQGKNKWIAEIRTKQIKKLRYFVNKEDAIAQRKKWELQYFGEYRYKAKDQ
ncbi:numod4 motif family protein [Paenibacillus elgii]|uniref:numod4 motif family protein n=1 Tax=Paenibacillus elgii TaxID=189691 RepID=UPI000248CFA1|nr:numod4 motif family protein [Paenibacillus elgii]